MVSSVSNNESLSQLLASLSSTSSQASQATSSTTTAASSTSSTSTSTSDPSQMFAELQSLAKTDPTKFKALAANISKQLTDAASTATDPKQKQMLTDLASKFNTASQTGDASGLAPPKGAHHHGHHGGGGPPAAAASSDSSSGASTASTSASSTTATGVSSYQNTVSSASADQMQALMQNIAQQVDAAFNASSASST